MELACRGMRKLIDKLYLIGERPFRNFISKIVQQFQLGELAMILQQQSQCSQLACCGSSRNRNLRHDADWSEFAGKHGKSQEISLKHCIEEGQQTLRIVRAIMVAAEIESKRPSVSADNGWKLVAVR